VRNVVITVIVLGSIAKPRPTKVSAPESFLQRKYYYIHSEAARRTMLSWQN
jgi:hypothetical protein